MGDDVTSPEVRSRMYIEAVRQMDERMSKSDVVRGMKNMRC
jgi:hypothetical protein